MSLLATLLLAAERAPSGGRGASTRDFGEIYDANVDLVWRALRRLGVAESAIEDCAQEVFVVVHRRLSEFEGRSSMSTWLYGIAAGIARNHRRTLRRRPETSIGDDEDRLEGAPSSPERRAEDAEALRTLERILESLDVDKREVFVLAELEELSAPEISAALGLNVNTVYTRIRAARAAFEQAVTRFRARDERRQAACR